GNGEAWRGYAACPHISAREGRARRLVPSPPPPTRDAQRIGRELGGFVAPPRPEVGVGELRGEEGVAPARCNETLQAFFQERNGFAKAPGDRVRMAQGRHQGARPSGDTQAFRHLDTLFKERDGGFR